MTTSIKAPVCCGQQLKVEKKDDMFHFICPKCGNKSQGKTPAEAAQNWNGWSQPENKPASEDLKKSVVASANLPAIPAGPQQLQAWAEGHMTELMKASAAFMDKPATARMIQKNLKYIARASLDKAWDTQEGRESIIEALEDSFYYGATLGDMGSVVPYGGVVEFVPGIEAFEFALTTGKNAPFEWIAVECIHENDICKRSRINGNFQIEFQNIPNERGDVVAVAVYGLEKKRSIVVGDIFEKSRLLEKARAHSSSYRYYLDDLAAINTARSEGTLKKENGKEYIEKIMPKRDGGTWTRKVYIQDLHNPYEGGDQPEMLRKAAGKTFFRPYMKTRNAVEMAGEWDRDEVELDDISVIDTVLKTAREQVKPENIKEAEYETMEPPRSAAPKQKTDDRI